MECQNRLEAILGTQLCLEGIYSSHNTGEVLRASYRVVRGIGKLLLECWDDLSRQFANYRGRREYYVANGGTAPSATHQYAYREDILRLGDVRDGILREIDDIVDGGWEYDIGFSLYIGKLLGLLGQDIAKF